MKWSERKRPKSYDQRVKSRFLLFPKCIDEEYRWLERVYYKQHYSNTMSYCGWEDDCWITKEEYLKLKKSSKI